MKGKKSQWSVEINRDSERGTSDKLTWLWRRAASWMETNCHIICHLMICCRISAAVTGGKLIR